MKAYSKLRVILEIILVAILIYSVAIVSIALGFPGLGHLALIVIVIAAILLD